MADITPFSPPEFLTGQTVEEIHKRMMESLPADFDRSEGGFPWDYTRPTATEKAEFVGYQLINTIRAIFSQWCEDYLLEDHADMRGMARKKAQAATALLTITGEKGTEIPAGFVVSTAATYDRPSISFRLDSAITLGAEPATVPVTAVDAGTVGNVGANTIIIVDAPIKGIKAITNKEPASGGIDAETYEALRDRIVTYNRSQGVSYVGSTADYERWAMEVQGVGKAQCQGGEKGDNTVKLIITGSDGKPASSDLQQAVYDHIMRPDDESQRLAGVNDLLIVTTPTTLTVAITASLILDGTATLETITEELAQRLTAYYLGEGAAEAIIRYTHIGSIILSCSGVTDYSHDSLLVNGSREDITISIGEIPVTGSEDITITEVGGA